MNVSSQHLEARLAEELEQRTEFCDWLSVCSSACGNPCGGSTTTCTTGPSGTGSVCTTSSKH
jgi:hypothetical protein